jgi:hypothetical protein
MATARGGGVEDEEEESSDFEVEASSEDCVSSAKLDGFCPLALSFWR